MKGEEDNGHGVTNLCTVSNLRSIHAVVEQVIFQDLRELCSVRQEPTEKFCGQLCECVVVRSKHSVWNALLCCALHRASDKS